MDLCLSETEHKVPYLEFELDDSIFGLLTVKPPSLSIILVFFNIVKRIWNTRWKTSINISSKYGICFLMSCLPIMSSKKRLQVDFLFTCISFLQKPPRFHPAKGCRSSEWWCKTTLSKINLGQYQIVRIEGLVLEFLLTGFKMFIDLIYLDHSDTSVWSPLSQTCD